MTTRYRVVSDGDGHDYVMEATLENEKAFEAWVSLTSENEDGWEPPNFLIPINGIHTLTFADPADYGRMLER